MLMRAGARPQQPQALLVRTARRSAQLLQPALDLDAGGLVLAAGHAAEARAGDAVALFVVVARRVAVDRGHHAHVGLEQPCGLLRAVLDPGPVLARRLAARPDPPLLVIATAMPSPVSPSKAT